MQGLLFDTDLEEKQSTEQRAPVELPHGFNIRVVSRRPNGTQAAKDETVIDVDRSHPSLGNRHILHRASDLDERARVIEKSRRDLDDDCVIRGPQYKAIVALAYRVAKGEKLALRCWCAPLPCHADHIVTKVVKLASALVVRD